MTRNALYAVVFLFFLTMAVGTANLLFTSHLISQVNANKASITQLCQSGNEARAQQVQLWEFVIHISKPPPHETPAHRAQRERTVARFVTHLHHVFAPRNCQEEPPR